MNTVVSLDLAKVLKEKGFDEYCKLCVEDGDETPLPFNCGNTMHKNSLHPYYSAPTIAEVVMWLYKKRGIWISVYEYKDYAADANDDDVFRTSHTKLKEFNCPIQAYEAAIEYTLKELEI